MEVNAVGHTGFRNRSVRGFVRSLFFYLFFSILKMLQVLFLMYNYLATLLLLLPNYMYTPLRIESLFDGIVAFRNIRNRVYL